VTRPKKPVVPEIPDTKEDLLREIGAVLDRVDAIMAQPRKTNIYFGRWSASGLEGENQRASQLAIRLDKLLNPTGDSELPGAKEAIIEAFGAEPGTVPPWSRPGSFLLWIDYVPCRCRWGGFVEAEAVVLAADPNSRWPSPAGTISLNAPAIAPSHRTVEDLFRQTLQASTLATERPTRGSYASRVKNEHPAFKLLPLSRDGRATAEQDLARPENAWLVQALKRGRINPIPLPRHLQAVQTTLFGG
jgi:hypothetical protein